MEPTSSRPRARGKKRDEAIERVRAGRPGSVEMPEQEDWVARFAGEKGEKRT